MLPDASSLPSGEKARQRTSPSCPVNSQAFQLLGLADIPHNNFEATFLVFLGMTAGGKGGAVGCDGDSMEVTSAGIPRTVYLFASDGIPKANASERQSE
jgi:hypothetical protein